jgi:hypothetical protein
MQKMSETPNLDHKVLMELAMKMADQGLLIEAGWVGLRAATLDSTTSLQQLHELRCVFFAGAQHLFSSLITILDPRDDVTGMDLQRLERIAEELQRFITEFELEIARAEGRA